MRVKTETRCGKERRTRDIDLPTGRDRRRQVERRKPLVVEVTISDAEWAFYFCRPPRQSGTVKDMQVSSILAHLRRVRRKRHDRNHERRKNSDRRQKDVRIRQGSERRVGVEPRLPDVVEIEVSEREWALYPWLKTGEDVVGAIEAWLIAIERIRR